MGGWIPLSADRLLLVGPPPAGARGRRVDRPRMRGWLVLGPRPRNPNTLRPMLAHGEITEAGALVHCGSLTVDELAMLELIGLHGDDRKIAEEFGLL